MTLDLNNLVLARGAHTPADGAACLMEAVSVYLDQSFSDRPHNVSSVLGAYGRRLNDLMPDEWRAKLVPLIPRIAACDSSLDQARMYLAVDWAMRVCAPMALDARGLNTQASTLRALPQLVDRETCLVGKTAAAAAAAYAAYAADAAAAAAYAADAADDADDADACAAYVVAAAAADAYDAYDAYDASDAAYAAYAAYAAAYAAGDAAAAIWQSALDLFERMIEVS